MAKNGQQHLESLRDGREVYIHGGKVADVTAHPAFRNSVAAAASLYDFQAAPENREALTFAAPVLTQQLYPRMIEMLRGLAGGGMIMLPSGIEDLADPAVADYALRAQRSPAFSPADRVKFFKLAWDAVGSEFASRHTQYEMFYAGAGFVTKGHSFRTYDWAGATGFVERLMGGYDLAEEIRGSSA